MDKKKASSKDSSGTEDYDAGGCKCISDDANDYNIKEETDTETETQTILRRRRSNKRNKSKKTLSSTDSPSTTPYDNSMLLYLLFAPETQDHIDTIAKSNNIPATEVRRMAEEITTF